MTPTRVLQFGLALAFFAVALGAFGAHAIRERVAADGLEIWRTAVTYQMYHAIALLAYALWTQQSGRSSRAVPWCFLVGIFFFSGSLYALVLTNVRWLGAITPLGGISFLLGWGAWWRAVTVYK